ncbi:MAG: cupredoxin domain-containing protein [Steroidobacteraceae bacterium]
MKAKVIFLMPMLLAVSLWARSETAPSTWATLPSARSQDTTVAIRDFAFSPASMTVAVGTTVRWKNFDGEPHTIRSVDMSFRSDPLDQNDSFAFKFDKPGIYRYVCSIHPQMIGTIVVKGEGP